MSRPADRKHRLNGKWIAGLCAVLCVLGMLWLVADAFAGTVAVPAKGKSKIIDRVQESGTLRAGVNVALPWLGQDPSTGNFFGPCIDIGNRIASLLKVKLDMKTSASDVLVAGLQADQFDLAIAPLFATEKRQQVIDFVNYTSAGQCYGVRKDNNKVNSLEDMNKPTVTIGTWTGSGQEYKIKEKYPKATINSIVMPTGGATRMEEVVAGRIDVATLDSARAYLVEHMFPQLKIIPGGPKNCIENPDIPIPIGMGLQKGDPEFKGFLEAVVADMQKEINASILKHSDLEFMLKTIKK